jgi:hypothetical protein
LTDPIESICFHPEIGEASAKNNPSRSEPATLPPGLATLKLPSQAIETVKFEREQVSVVPPPATVIVAALALNAKNAPATAPAA